MIFIGVNAPIVIKFCSTATIPSRKYNFGKLQFIKISNSENSEIVLRQNFWNFHIMKRTTYAEFFQSIVVKIGN